MSDGNMDVGSYNKSLLMAMNVSDTFERSNTSSGSDIAYYHLKYIVSACSLITFCFGIFGNSLVIYILARFSDVRTKSVANYYILNLALADEAFMLALPFFFHATYSNTWIFGNPLCKIMFILREINKYSSIFTLVALSLDRYIASFHNYGHLRTIRVGKIVCVGVWIASIGMCMPYILYSYSIESRGRHSCRINFPQANALYHRKVWFYSQLTIAMLVPFMLISVSYCLLIRRLRAIMRPRGANRIRKPNRKMTRTVLVVVAIFVTCHFPYYILELLNIQKVERYATRDPSADVSGANFIVFIYFNTLAQILVYISSCCNPVLYGILNENFRQLYKRALCCLLDNRPVLTSANNRRSSIGQTRNNNTETTPLQKHRVLLDDCTPAPENARLSQISLVEVNDRHRSTVSTFV